MNSTYDTFANKTIVTTMKPRTWRNDKKPYASRWKNVFGTTKLNINISQGFYH